MRACGKWCANLPPAVLAAAALLALPRGVNDYEQFVINTIIVYCLVSVGFNVVLGYLGQLAFANAAFFGAGAYTAGLLMVHFSWPYLPALAGGAIAGALTGAAVSLPALRMQGYTLVIVTLAFTDLMRWLYVHGGGVTFGSGGFNIPQATILGIDITREEHKYYVLLAVTALGIWATARLMSSRFGRAIIAVRNNEMAASTMGISVPRTKIIAFAWSGFIVGLAGGLYALLNGRITPENFGLPQMLQHFAIVMAGGLGSIAGSILGAVLLAAAPELLRNFPGAEEILFSLLLIAVLFFMPNGIGGLIAARLPRWRERHYRE